MLAISLNESLEIIDLTSATEIFLGRSRRSVIGKLIWETIEKTPILEDVFLRQSEVSLLEHALEMRFVENALCDLHVQYRDDQYLVWIYHQGKTWQRQRSENARDVAKLASGMAAMLAHEIRNPLGSIKGAAQLLTDGLSPEDQELCEVIDVEAARISRLVAEFEEIAGSSPAQIEPVNVHLLLDQLIRSARAGYARDIKFSENYDPSLPLIACDQDRLLRALHNIVKNGSEAVFDLYQNNIDRSKISIQTRFVTGKRRGNTELPVEIMISDNGPGIPENLREDIFKPFVTSKKSGTGLGLSIVARSIDEIGGMVEMNTDDHGTKIGIYLPIWKEKD